MLVQIEKPYSDMIEKMIALGLANDANEVIKQSLLIYQNQIEFEELYLVDKAVKSEMNTLGISNKELIPIDDVLREAGL